MVDTSEKIQLVQQSRYVAKLRRMPHHAKVVPSGASNNRHRLSQVSAISGDVLQAVAKPHLYYEDSEITKWIRGNINKRVCKQFVPQPSKSKDNHASASTAVAVLGTGSNLPNVPLPPESIPLPLGKLAFEEFASQGTALSSPAKKTSHNAPQVTPPRARRYVVNPESANSGRPAQQTPVDSGQTGGASGTARELVEKKTLGSPSLNVPGPGRERHVSGKSKESEATCLCGYKRSRHSRHAQAAFRPGDTDWSTLTHTETKPTDAFGEMEHVAYGQKISKYVRAEQKTDMEDTMMDLMQNQWKLSMPNLLISVTGGARNFTMKPRLKGVFRKGLMKAATTTGAWIITGGMHAGVMKHVGEAVRDHMEAHGNKNEVIAVGIAPWGCVNNKESLIEPNLRGLWPAQYRPMDTQFKKVTPLDPNHSHFILVDNGTQHQYATEINFRAELESRIARMKTDGTEESAVSIPIVCVVLEGGPGTLETVKSAIHNGTPAVIVEGSGRAADVLAYAYAHSSEEEVEVVDKIGNRHRKVISIVESDLWDNVKKKIQDEWKTDKDIDSRVSWVRECLEKRDHMTVFQMDGRNSAKDIDLAILQALLKVNRDKRIDQLKLALAWNRIDVAKSEIFTDNVQWEAAELEEVMFTAILNNRVHFVELFLDNGVSLKDFLTTKRLLQLYNGIPKNCLLYQLLKKKKKQKYVSLHNVGQVVQDLTGDSYHPLYLRDERYRNLDCDAVMTEPSDLVNTAETVDEAGDAYASRNAKIYIDETTGEEYMIADFDEPIRELFLWSVLMQRQDMAMVFWQEGRESIAAALTAQRILTSLRSRTNDSELLMKLENLIHHFEKLSVGVLSKCYDSDGKKTQLLMIREMKNFGNATDVLLAVEADNKVFIAHAAFQGLLNDIWMGRMHSDTGLLKMVTCMCLPMLVVPLVGFRKEKRKEILGHAEKAPEPQRPQTVQEKPAASGSVRPLKPRMSMKVAEPAGDAEEHEKAPSISWYAKLGYFYNAPVITFIVNSISYIAFLLLYSVVMLTDFYAFPRLSVAEYVLIVWVFSLLIEEIRQVVTDDSTSFWLKLRSYVSDVWNVLDMVALISFIVGLALRFVPVSSCTLCFPVARIILAINLMTFFFRILHIFSIHKELGPKLVMIGRMMVDLAYFVIILLVFIVSYGIAIQVILYPNSALNFQLFRDILHKAYFQIYGELFLEEIEGENGCTQDPLLWQNNTMPRCADQTVDWVVPVLMGVYILITNVLMLNLLIAMFSYTFSLVQEKTDLHWYFQRYFLIKEYYDRPPFPPPFIILNHVFLIVRYFLRCSGRCLGAESDFRMKCQEMEEKQLTMWESMNRDEYLRKSQAKTKQTLEHRVKETNERMDTISLKVDEISESSLLRQEASDGQEINQCKLPPVLDERLNYLEEQLQRTAHALNWIMDAMSDKGMVAKQKKPDLKNLSNLREEARKKREDEKKKKKEEFESMLLRQLELHLKSRTSHYPSSNREKTAIYRTPVPDSQVPWEEDWPNYNPIEYTDEVILRGPHYADVNLMAMPVEHRTKLAFNSVDSASGVNRKSHCGTYQVVDGLPLNPKGRTGLCGRGVLGRFGPNHAGDPVVTRWKRENDAIVQEGGKQVLEFVSIQRTDNNEWAIPGAILETGMEIHQCLKAEFIEEALGTLMDDASARPQITAKLNKLWQTGKEVYRGYSDDPRNTDNAWMETIAYNYHDQDGDILGQFQVRAGDTVEMVRWQPISSRQSLYGAHLSILKAVADAHKAAF